ncbi:unnamed protein product [Arctogadus glacialis]
MRLMSSLSISFVPLQTVGLCNLEPNRDRQALSPGGVVIRRQDSGPQVSTGLRLLPPPARHGSNSERAKGPGEGSAGGQPPLTGNRSLCQGEDVDTIC